MQSGALLPDPVWNLVLISWMDLLMLTVGEVDVEERERQPITARPKTMAVGFSRFVGRTLPSSSLNPAHDGIQPR